MGVYTIRKGSETGRLWRGQLAQRRRPLAVANERWWPLLIAGAPGWPASVTVALELVLTAKHCKKGDSRTLHMPLIETIKEKVEKITGWGRPKRREVDAVLRPRKPNVFRFADDGTVPNNSKLPLILYRGRSAPRTHPIPRLCLRSSSSAMVGRAPGGTASTITSTITPKFMRCLGSLAAMSPCALVNPEVVHSNSRRATSRSCPRGRGIRRSTEATTCSWLAHIRRSESTISAAAPRRNTSVP
jgi:hypothetical protein